jgi:glucose/arabinose dehydrogenase
MVQCSGLRVGLLAAGLILPLVLSASSVHAGLEGLVRVASGLTRPVYVTHAPNDPTRLFIVERDGVIRILDLGQGTVHATPFLTISDTDPEGDGGLQSMAFHPDYATNGLFYVHVTVDNGGVVITGDVSPFSSHIREYSVSAGDPDQADPTPTEIISWVQPNTPHNGGWIGFGPPGASTQLLYIMSGDGGWQRDPDNHAQTVVNEPLGKILRIDVETDDFPADPDRNYAIPAGNPFVGQAGDDEIWAYGLRNPWRASFDAQTGDLWIGDVGQDAFEEIDFQPAASSGGENYAWNRREGFSSHLGGALLPGDVEPVYDYPAGSGEFEGHTVVGGYVYRGSDPGLRGLYFFADAITANVWIFDPADPLGTRERINDDLIPDVGSLSRPASFGEDAMGNLYIVDYHHSSSGEVFRIKTVSVNPAPTLQGWGLVLLVLTLGMVGIYAQRSGVSRMRGRSA